MFKSIDGLHQTYSASVTVSPRGTVWIKHGDADEISVFDGYKIQTMPSPGRDSFRIYESRTGQLWSLYSSGLVVYASEQWVYHPIPEIRTEIQSDPLRQLRQVPLLPAEHDRVFFLLPEKLMEYDSATRRTMLVKHVSETGLGRFSELAESRDGGIWITGAKGVAKLPGPIRQVRPGMAHQEFLLDDKVNAENLQRPFEDEFGGLTVAATDSRLTGHRVVLHLTGETWTGRPVEANIKQAWSGWDRLSWAYTINSLFRLDPLPSTAAGRERIWAGQYKDVAVQPNQVFWLATSEGLLRYAPSLWRTPVPVEDMTSHVHAMLEDQKKRLWFGSSDFLLVLQDGAARTVKWPEGLEGSFETADRLYRLPGGRIAVSAGNRSLIFDPETEQFEIFSAADGRPLKLLGQFPDGSVAVQVQAHGTTATEGLVLERFDGVAFEPIPFQGESIWGANPQLTFVAPLENGDIWVGSSQGLGRIRGKDLEIFGPTKGFPGATVHCLTDIGGGRLWCGGSGRIFEFNGKSWSMVLDGLDRINAITRGPDGRIWVATADGLFSYLGGSLIQHGIEEGLPSAGVSAVFVDSQGVLWAGTTRGLTQYHPEADQAAPKTLAPLLEDARGNVTDENANVLLNGIDKWQSTPAGRLLFSTRLDEGAWSPFSDSMVKRLERLGAGQHRLDVRAMDRNWNEDPEFVSLDFRVVLNWYKDPRLIGSVLSGTVLVLFFAGLAINRHLRLIRSYAQVERIVRIRTRDLERANEELLQSQKMKALGTLAAGIAHDFNNMLSIIRGSAQIIENNLEDKQKILTRLSRIQAVVEQGSGIVRTILGLSRVKEKDLVETDLNDLVENAVQLLDERFLQEVTVEFRPAHPLPTVKVARELIQQMFLNLVLNAADAMEHRGQIVVSTGIAHHLPADMALSPAKATAHVYLSVQDTGCGIDPDILPRIFEPFFTTKALSVRRGTGLGLSIVYELARQMGYGVEVKSTVGKGSVFRIILPVGETEQGQ